MNKELIKIKEKVDTYKETYKKVDFVLELMDSFDLNKKDIRFLIPDIKMFDDIVFKPHPLSDVPAMGDAIIGVLEFDNGYFAYGVGGGTGL